MKTSTINKKKQKNFQEQLKNGDPEGKFKPLHKFNPIRIRYIKNNIIETFKLKEIKEPLKNVKILDVG